FEAFSFGDAGAAGGEVDDVRRHAFGGGFEGDPGARGVFVEQVDDGAAAQGRQLLHGAFADLGEFPRGVEDEQGLVSGEVSGGKQVLHQRAPPGVAAADSGAPGRGLAGPMRTASRPWSSSSSTVTL